MILKQYKGTKAVAEAIIESVFIDGTEQGKLNIAVSGGSTPRLLFELLAEERYQQAVKWANVQLFWVDERCVPPTDADSNYLMTYESLLKHVALKEEQIHRIKGEASAQEEAERYTRLVEAKLNKEDGLPVFDVIILGLGDDGHTSSIFPSEMELLEAKIPYLPARNPYSGQQRIALTGQTILKAKRLLFHSVGAGKKEVLQEIISQDPKSETYPSAYFFRHRSDVELYTDQDLL